MSEPGARRGSIVGSSPSSGGDEDVTQVAERHLGTRAEAVGSIVGRYVVIGEVGRGGMGRVLRAYDPKLLREVALKELTRRLVRDNGGQRLVAEARAMAKLSHPNVVSVYDVEELPGGELVLVMEFVDGLPLDRWLTAHDRSWREVLRHFAAAGRGLMAAHAEGLLHRDFKPSNVLVARRSGSEAQTAEGWRRDFVKVTDFGLAKLADGSSQTADGIETSAPDRSDEHLTATGAVLGTPLYMPPEQHRAAPLTPAADQYAFCVSLWLGLTGTPPFAPPDLHHRKAQGPPPWPGGPTPRSVVRALMRGLSPEPDDRWPTMADLLDALDVDPGPRRRRWGFAAAVVGGTGVALSAMSGSDEPPCQGAEQQLQGIWDESRRDATRAAFTDIGLAYATRAWDRTERALDAYRERWVEMHTDACEATSVRGDQSERALDLRMACLRRAATRLRATVNALADANEEMVQHAHRLTAALPPLQRCDDIEALSHDEEPPTADEADTVDEIREQLADADALREAGRFEAAHEVLADVRPLVDRTIYPKVRAEFFLSLGMVLDQLGRYEPAEAELSRALDVASRAHLAQALFDAATELAMVVGYRQEHPAEARQYEAIARGFAADDPLQTARLDHVSALVLQVAGDYEAAEDTFRRALQARVERLGPDHLDVIETRNVLANVLKLRGRPGDAEREYRAVIAAWTDALGPDHPSVGVARNNLANALKHQGSYLEAEAELRRALQIRIGVLGEHHPDVAQSRNNLAIVLQEMGRHADAVEQARAALAIRIETLGPDHPKVATARINLAGMLLPAGEIEEAEAQARAGVASLERTLAPDHPDLAQARGNFGAILLERGKVEEAESALRRSLEVLEPALGADHPVVALLRPNLASALLDTGRLGEAEAVYRSSIAALTNAVGDAHPQLPLLRIGLARVLLARERPAEAVSEAEAAWDQAQGDDVDVEMRGRVATVLARAMWQTGDRAARLRARSLAGDTLAELRDAGPEVAGVASELRRWLDAHP